MKVDHGTAKSNALAIKKSGFRDSCFPKFSSRQIFNRDTDNKLPGTLGYGVYVFQDNYKLAYDFITTSGTSKPCVLEFDIEFDEDRVIIMDGKSAETKAYNDWVKGERVQKGLKHLRKKYSNDPSKQHALDGAVMELFVSGLLETKSLDTVDCIAGPTHTNTKEQSDLLTINGYEISIRNNDIIEYDTMKIN